MTGRQHILRSRIRLMRLLLRRWHDSLTTRMRTRIVLGAFLLLMLAYAWFLFRGIPEPAIEPMQFTIYKPK